MKKIISILTAISFVFVCVINNGIRISAENTEIIKNMVICAKFSDSQEDNFMAECTDDLIKMCNDTSTSKSMKSYLKTISYGQADTDFYFPQLTDGVIIPCTIDGKKEDYNDSQSLAENILRHIEIPDNADVDGNNDGIIDNIIIIVEGNADTMSDVIWPKAFYLTGFKIGNYYAGAVNIHNSYIILENIVANVGTLCHEFLHTLGYPDLYRADASTGNPVGWWDIMSASSVFLQYPLAYQRANISGWLDMQTITSDGTYTLKPVSDSSGNRLYILKTPLSDDEFFAVEYRKKGSVYNDDMDAKIYGSGLVVYRINSKEHGNYRGSADEIYVFRPEETSANSGNGNLYKSCYGGEDCPSEIGSLDFTADFSDNALVYSDGSNSGIKISDITFDDESLTFTAEFADTSQVSFWQGANSILPENQTAVYYDIIPSSDGNSMYTAVSDTSGVSVYRLENGKSVNLGTVPDSYVCSPKLSICGNSLWIICNDKDYNLNLYRLDENSKEWTKMHTISGNIQYSDISSCGSKICIAYTEGFFPYSLSTAIYDTENSEFSVIGENICSNAVSVCAEYLSADRIIISYRDADDGNYPKSTAYNGSDWSVSELSETSCGSVSSSSEYVASYGGCSEIFKDSEKIQIPDSIDKSSCFEMSICKDSDGTLYAAFQTQNDSTTSVYSYKDGLWKKIGNNVSEKIVFSPRLTISDGNLYFSFTDDSGCLNMKKFSIGKSSSLTVYDLLTLKKYLLNGGSTVPDYDFNKDGSLDIYDLCTLKHMILS